MDNEVRSKHSTYLQFPCLSGRGKTVEDERHLVEKFKFIPVRNCIASISTMLFLLLSNSACSTFFILLK